MCVIRRLFWGTKHQNLGTGPVLYAKYTQKGCSLEKSLGCCILQHTCCIQVKNAAYWFFHWKLLQMDWKSLFDILYNKKGQLFSNIPKKTIAAACCCIYAAYRPKYCIMVFFIKNSTEYIKNQYLEYFVTKKGWLLSTIPKKAPAAAHCSILAAAHCSILAAYG